MRRQNFFEGPWVTMVLLSISVLMFGVEILAGGSTNSRVLFDLGARFAPALTLGNQWWRLLTPIFLHVGFMHLFVNMATLWYLGRITEQALGIGGSSSFTLLVGSPGTLPDCCLAVPMRLPRVRPHRCSACLAPSSWLGMCSATGRTSRQ